MSIKIRLHNTGKVELKECLSENREVLRSQLKKLVMLFCLNNSITICRPAVAIGSGFSPNKHPRNRIVGAQSPLTV